MTRDTWGQHLSWIHNDQLSLNKNHSTVRYKQGNLQQLLAAEAPVPLVVSPGGQLWQPAGLPPVLYVPAGQSVAAYVITPSGLMLTVRP